MADVPVPSLARAREEKISELSTFFANDDLTLEDLERRIERVYKAASVTELETITADLRSAATLARPAELSRGAPPVPTRGRSRGPGNALTTPVAPSTRVLSIMSSSRRVGRWDVAQKLDVVGVMSDSVIDLTHATLPAGIVDVDLSIVMSSFKLILPPGMRVINEAHAFMASIHSRADESASSNSPSTIRLTGYAVMADVHIVVRRPEVPYDSEIDDDEDD
ncbi:MAG TPA: hypothetical protein VGM67_08070 [Gemmatimonadaceae bacterium]|jgi:hypothetical protein